MNEGEDLVYSAVAVRLDTRKKIKGEISPFALHAGS